MTGDPGQDILENKADQKDRGLEALDEEIAEVKSLMEESFRAEKIAEAHADILREELADRPDRNACNAEPAKSGRDLLSEAKADDLAFIFGNDPDLSDTDGESAEDSAKEFGKSSLDDAEAGNDRKNSGLEEAYF